jgi:hypothetical protein
MAFLALAHGIVGWFIMLRIVVGDSYDIMSHHPFSALIASVMLVVVTFYSLKTLPLVTAIGSIVWRNPNPKNWTGEGKVPEKLIASCRPFLDKRSARVQFYTLLLCARAPPLCKDLRKLFFFFAAIANGLFWTKP